MAAGSLGTGRDRDRLGRLIMPAGSRSAPNLRVERAMLRSGSTALACIDEAGRGALCGPVSVGVVVVTADTPPAPRGVRDSKLLTEAQRRELVPAIERWAPHAVGMAGAAEIDEFGIMAALRLAGQRALQLLPEWPDHVLLDGDHDYLTPPRQGALFDEPTESLAYPPVTTVIKADRRCAGVAAASILAKTARDHLMIELHDSFPDYGWAGNKGYGAADHLEALRRYGPTSHHRVSWNLPTP